MFQPRFDAFFHGPLCHDLNQMARAKKAFATKHVALQIFTLMQGHRSWVGPHRVSGSLIGFGDYELSDVAPNTAAVIIILSSTHMGVVPLQNAKFGMGGS